MGNTSSHDTVSTGTVTGTTTIPTAVSVTPPSVPSSSSSSSSSTVSLSTPSSSSATDRSMNDKNNRKRRNTRQEKESLTTSTVQPPALPSQATTDTPLSSTSRTISSASSSASSSSSTIVSSSSAANSSSTTVSSTATVTTVTSPPSLLSTPSWYRQAMDGYDMIINAIIRPPRADDYGEKDLGPKHFRYRTTTYQREDGTLMNSRGQTIVWTQWKPTSAYPATPTSSGSLPSPHGRSLATLPCVIYLHGNSSCRAGAISDCLLTSLDEGATVFSFDFTGSGKSDGEYVTLGYNECKDVADIIRFIRTEGRASSLALWGRSMGATTALLYAATDPLIAGLVLDSPFADLRRLCCELVGVGSASLGINQRLLTFGLPLALRIIRSSVKQRSGLDIFDLHPITSVPLAHVPVLFVAGLQDDFIVPQHSIDLHKAYGPTGADVYKLIRIIPGDHNSVRSAEFLNYAGGFLRRTLGCDAVNRTSSSTSPNNGAATTIINAKLTHPVSSSAAITSTSLSSSAMVSVTGKGSVVPPLLPPVLPSLPSSSTSNRVINRSLTNTPTSTTTITKTTTDSLSVESSTTITTNTTESPDATTLSSSDTPFHIVPLTVGVLQPGVHSTAVDSKGTIKLSTFNGTTPPPPTVLPGIRTTRSSSSSPVINRTSSTVVMNTWENVQQNLEEDEMLAIALSLQEESPRE